MDNSKLLDIYTVGQIMGIYGICPELALSVFSERDENHRTHFLECIYGIIEFKKEYGRDYSIELKLIKDIQQL